jgi:uncharacterized protein (TIGR02246 family)
MLKTISADDEKAIRALIDQLTSAWNAGDGAAYGRPFSEDCDYITFNGERSRGCAAVVADHQALFDTHLKGSRLMFESVEMRPVTTDVVLVHSIGNSLLNGQRAPSPSRRSIQTLVAVRRAGEWKFTAFQNSRVFKITPFRAILMKFGI